MCKIVNVNKEEYDILIMRPSKWGNPYSHKEGTLAKYKTKDRTESIKMYELHLLENIELYNSLYELKYKRLGCICKPKSCHGDILKKYVDKLEDIDKRKDLLKN